jgi:hypothetical protein
MIHKASATEKKEKRRRLFPILLADFETLRDWMCFDAVNGCPKLEPLLEHDNL